MKNKEVTLIVRNNTTVIQPIQLGIAPSDFSGINATTSYNWNVTSQNFNDLTTLSLTYSLNGSTTTVQTNISDSSLTGVIAALNSLNVGRFWSYTEGGNTYITTYNDFVTYDDLTINNNGDILVTVLIPAAPLVVVFSMALTSPNQVTFDWGDGNTNTYNVSNPSPSHIYTTTGTKTISIKFAAASSLTSITFSTSTTQVSITHPNLTALITYINSNGILSSFDGTNLSGSSLLNFVRLDNIANLGSFDGTGLPAALQKLWLFASNITSVNTTTIPAGVNDFRASNNHLTVSNVNAILIALDSNGLLNGNLNLGGQTPAAAPSGAGITAKNNLISKGWTVLTD